MDKISDIIEEGKKTVQGENEKGEESLSKKYLRKQTERDKKASYENPYKSFTGRYLKRMKNELFTLYRPSSIISEQFRMVRASLIRLAQYRQIKTMLVTSSLPEEGKTFVSANLAISLAQGFNGRVILVDTDLRRPSVHKLFRLKPEGLSNFLRNERKLSELLCATDVKNLYVLPAGPSPDNPSELLSSKKMKQFLDELTSLYPDAFIIFDSVPVLLSEALALADLVDSIIIVIKAGKTGRDFVKNTIEQLGREKVVGIVLNHCKKYLKNYRNYYHYYNVKKKK